MSSVSEAAQTETDAAPDLCTAQELLGSYALVSQLAAGHLTTLHRAHVAGAEARGSAREQDSDAGASLVVKRLHYGFVHELADRELLLAAGRAGMRVRSPNVIRVLSVHEDPEPFVVMEHVPGVTLSTLLAEIEEEEALRFVLPVLVDLLEGLEVLHGLRSADGAASSLVHGAPCARHVLIGEDGVARLFDLTHAIGTGFSVAARRSLRLSPAEMAPEQVLAPMHVDARCDLFIVGTVLWRALTGQPLFEHAQREEALSQLLRKPILAPSEAGSVAGKRFDRICLRALARSRAERYASAAEMARELKVEAERAELFASREEIASLVRTLAAANHEADQENEVLLVPQAARDGEPAAHAPRADGAVGRTESGSRVEARGSAREQNTEARGSARERNTEARVSTGASALPATGETGDPLDILTLHHQGSTRFGFDGALEALRTPIAQEEGPALSQAIPSVSELPPREEGQSSRESGAWYEGLPSIFPNREQPRTKAPFWLGGIAAAAALIGSVLIDNPPWQTAERTGLREGDRIQVRGEMVGRPAGVPGYAVFFEPQQSRASSALPPREREADARGSAREQNNVEARGSAREQNDVEAREAPACMPSPEQAARLKTPPADVEARGSAREQNLVQALGATGEKPAATHPRAKRFLSPLPPNPY